MPNTTSLTQKILGIILGIFAILPLLIVFGPLASLPIESPEDSVLKTAIMVSTISASLYCVTLGTLIFAGKVKPYFFADKQDKIKIDLIGSIFLLPVFVSFSFVVFTSAKSNVWIVLMVAATILCIWSLFHNIRNLRTIIK